MLLFRFIEKCCCASVLSVMKRLYTLQLLLRSEKQVRYRSATSALKWFLTFQCDGLPQSWRTKILHSLYPRLKCAHLNEFIVDDLYCYHLEAKYLKWSRAFYQFHIFSHSSILRFPLSLLTIDPLLFRRVSLVGVLTWGTNNPGREILHYTHHTHFTFHLIVQLLSHSEKALFLVLEWTARLLICDREAKPHSRSWPPWNLMS